jgi:hypothetical protein
MNIPTAVINKFNETGAELTTAPVPNGDRIAEGTNRDSIAMAKTLALMAVDVSSPGANIQSTEQNVGVHRKIADGQNNGELNITFRCSGDMAERKLFDTWRSVIFRDNKTVAYYDDYVCPNLDIYTQDNAGHHTYHVGLEEAYPTTITELPLNAEQENAVLLFQVTFTFRRVFNVTLDANKNNSLPVWAQDTGRASLTASSLPPAPYNANTHLFLIDIYKNIERVKQQIENGTLNKAMGQKLILNIIRDINASGVNTGITGQALGYANSLIYLLGKK